MPVDYMHRTKHRTALGIAAEKGFYNVVEKLLSHGAKAAFKDGCGKTALDYADENEQVECIELLDHFADMESVSGTATDECDAKELALKQFISMAYRQTTVTPMRWNNIDQDLLFHVIRHIHLEKPTDGSILVFLPGYEDIMMQKEMIETELPTNNYKLFVLHSGVNGASNDEQAMVFDKMPAGIRKIVLSTNIAETSLTINDVVRGILRYCFIILYLEWMN